MTTQTLFVLYCGTPGILFLTGSPWMQALSLFWPFLWIGLVAVALTTRYIMDQI